MERLSEVLAELFALFETIDSPLLIVEVVLTALMAHRLRSSSSDSSFRTSVEVVSSDSSVSEEVETAPPEVPSIEECSPSEVIRSKFSDDLALLQKDYNSLSDDELSRLRALLTYLGDRK